MLEYFTMEVIQGLAEIYWSYSCISKKLLKLIIVRQKSFEVIREHPLKLIMVKQKLIDVTQG